MANYLTEAAYLRWYRQYQVNLQLCLELLNHLRIRLDSLPLLEEVVDIENKVNELDENLEKVTPRNFSSYDKPLTSSEKLVENFKVLINLVLRMAGREDKYSGIYQEEKEKILALHRDFHFKEQLKDIRDRIEVLETVEDEPYEAESLETQEEQAPNVAEQSG